MFSSNVENVLNPLSLLLPTQSGHENFNGYTLSQTQLSDDSRFNFSVLNPQVISSEPLIHYTELQRNSMMNNDNHEDEILDGCSRLGVLAKKPVKKDRHSKINTAKGLRDRRVRLSIGIAREFFDLQEMLGFDKASKTLEWLLNNSRKAIKELAQTKNGYETKSFVSDSSTDNILEVVSEIKKPENYVSNCKDKRRSKSAVKEIRAKARHKMCNKTSCPDQVANQSRASEHFMWSNIRQCEEAEILSSSNVYRHNAMISLYEQTIHHEVLTSGFVNKNLNSSVPGFEQPNLCDGMNSKDSTSSNNSSSNCVLEVTQNWGMNNNNNQFIDSAFCAMNNSNLSGGFQVYGKPW